MSLKEVPTIISHKHQFQELAMTENDITTPENQIEVSQRPSSTQFSMWKTSKDGSVRHIDIPHKGRADSLSHISDGGICWLHPPDQKWSPSFYLSERGLDNVHIYLWITKDLCWVQSWLLPGLIIGGLACLYAFFLVLRACWRRNISEFWIKFAEMMWLFANAWWMIGELHDDHYGYFDDGEKSIVDKHTKEAGIIFICTLVWITLYYLLLKPLNLLEETKEEQLLAIKNDPTSHLQPRFSFFFKTWNEYENIHIFFWVGKDTAWNWWLQSMWLLFLIPTLVIGFDFVYLTLRSRRLMIDHAHYFAQFMWVLANAVWAGGEFWFTPHHDSAIPFSRFSSEARRTSRWYSSWVVLGAYIPLLALYVLWLYYTCCGDISPILTKNVTDTKADVDIEEDGDGRVGSDSRSSDVMRDSEERASTFTVNPLVPMREVSTQSHPSLLSQSQSLIASQSPVSKHEKASFKVHSSKSVGSRNHSSVSNSTSDNEMSHELRLSDLSESTCVIHGAEI